MTAALLERVPRGRVVAIDLSPGMAREARAKLASLHALVVQANALALPLRAAVDAVFSTATRAYFDYLPELPGLDGEEARRVLSAAYADILATRDELTRDGGPPAAETLRFWAMIGMASGAAPDAMAVTWL